MKLYRVLLIVLFSSFFLSLNAQVFIGGGASFTSSADEKENNNTLTDKQSTFGFAFSPNVGVFLSENLAIGIDLNLRTSTKKSGIDPETILKQSSIGVNPYMRYYAWSWNKFSVFGQGNIGVNLLKSTVEYEGIVGDAKVTQFYISVYPGLSYDVSEKLSLETSINFLSFGYDHSVVEDDSYSYTKSEFYFGAGLDNIVNTGYISIGAKYKF